MMKSWTSTYSAWCVSAIAISVYGYDAIRVSERFRKHKRRKSRKGRWEAWRMNRTIPPIPQRTSRRRKKVRVIPLEYIDEFPGHPFKVLDDESMQKLMNSIEEIGVQSPIVARIKEDRDTRSFRVTGGFMPAAGWD